MWDKQMGTLSLSNFLSFSITIFDGVFVITDFSFNISLKKYDTQASIFENFAFILFLTEHWLIMWTPSLLSYQSFPKIILINTVMLILFRNYSPFCQLLYLFINTYYLTQKRVTREFFSWKISVYLQEVACSWFNIFSFSSYLPLHHLGDRAKRNYVGLQQEWWPRVQRGNFLTEGWDSAESLQAAEPPCSVSNSPRIYKYWKPHQVGDRFTKQNTKIYWNGRKTTFRICTHLGLS